MDKEEFIAWQNKKSDISMGIAKMFEKHGLMPSECLAVLMNSTTSMLVTLNMSLGKEKTEELFNTLIETLKKEFSSKMEYFDGKSVDDLLAEAMIHTVMSKK